MEITRKNIRIWSMLGMRRVLGMFINELAEQDERIVFATADVGRYFGVTDYQKKYPKRYVDVGIAEQNLVAVSAGLAKEGYHVFAATYATFVTARALDQVRVNLGYMKLGVKLVGVGGGVAEGDLSATHMGLEDVADIRAIPGIAIICPADATELIKAMAALRDFEGPVYLRLTGKTNLPMVYREDYVFEIGKSVCLKDGRDIVIISTGCIVGNVLKAAEELERRGLSCKVINMHTIRPLDEAELLKDKDYPLVVTVEEHMIIGGLGSAVVEFYSDKKTTSVIYRIGIQSEYPAATEYENILRNIGLDAKGISNTIWDKYQEVVGE